DVAAGLGAQSKRATDPGAKRYSDGTRRAFGYASPDFPEEKRGGVIDEANLRRLPAKTSCKRDFQVYAEQRLELMAHLADALLVVEGTGHANIRPRDFCERDACGLRSPSCEGVKEAYKSVGGIAHGVRRTGLPWERGARQ